MANLTGVFLVLLYGSIFASFYGCVENIVVMYRRSIKENVRIVIECFCEKKRRKITEICVFVCVQISLKEALVDEVKFLMTCKGVKDVSDRKNSKSDNSGESDRSNQSRYSPVSNNQVHGSNALLNLQ